MQSPPRSRASRRNLRPSLKTMQRRSRASTLSPVARSDSSSSAPSPGSARAGLLDICAEMEHARFRRTLRRRRAAFERSKTPSPPSSVSSSPAVLSPYYSPAGLPNELEQFAANATISVYDEDFPQALNTTLHEYAEDRTMLDAICSQANRELTLDLLWGADLGVGETMCPEWIDRQ